MLPFAVFTGLVLVMLVAVVGGHHLRQPRPVRRHVGAPASREDRRERVDAAPALRVRNHPTG